MISSAFTRQKTSAKGKKFITILGIMLLSLSTSSSLKAQRSSGGDRWTGGLIAGANFSQVDGDGYRGYNKTSPSLGGILYMPVPDIDIADGMLAWSLEVLYNGKGAKGSGPTTAITVQSQSIDLLYAEVPLQLNYWRGPRKSIYGTGLSLGYLGFSEEKIISTSGQVFQFPFRRIDLSFILTANLHIGHGFFLSPRFQYSLLNIRRRNDDLNAFGRSQQFNNVWGIKLMYLFNTER